MLVVIKKYKFFIKKTNFIRFIIKLKRINIDLKKVKAIVNQQELENIIQPRRLGLKFVLEAIGGGGGQGGFA